MDAIVAFVAITYSLSVVLSLIVGLTGGHESALAGPAYLSTTFVPAVATLVVALSFDERPRVRWDRLPVRYLPVALFLIPGTLHAAGLPVLVMLDGRLPWQAWLKPQADGLYHSPASLGWGVLTTPELVTRIALNAIVGLIVVSLLTLFEEIGWRAWLLPRLSDRIGPRSAVVLTAIAWALWHVPFQLSGVQHVDGIAPVMLASAMPIGITVAGVVLGWLWLRTESIWVVSIAHGALNDWGQYAFKYMDDSGRVRNDVLSLGAGFVVLSAIALVLLWRADPSGSSDLVGQA